MAFSNMVKYLSWGEANKASSEDCRGCAVEKKNGGALETARAQTEPTEPTEPGYE